MARPKASAKAVQPEDEAQQQAEPKASANQAVVPDGFLPVKYTGRREPHSDGLYGTYITWAKSGTVQLVPEDVARKMVAINRDVYHPGQYDGQAAPETAPAKPAEDTDRQELDLTIQTMDKVALELYARTHFGQELDRRRNVEELRRSVALMIDQFGAP